eukprot:COSAG01_NODE_50_length_31487_cov_90.470243_26_plen_55_part_00
MAACMAAPAGRPAVIPSHCMEDYCAGSGWILVFGLISKTFGAASKLLELDQVGF